MSTELQTWIQVILGLAAIVALIASATKLWHRVEDLDKRVQKLENEMVTKDAVEKRFDDLEKLIKTRGRWAHRTSNLCLEILALVAEDSPKERAIQDIIRRHRRDETDDTTDET